MCSFSLERFQSGTPVKTKSGINVEYIAVLPENIPARLVVSVGGRMANYYMDGTYLGNENPSNDDLEMVGYFDR